MGGQNGFARSREEGVWLVGERGLLGRQLATEMGKCGLAFWASDKEVDISSPEQLDAFARGKSIRWIVNCAAYTAVDRAETEKAEAFRVNAQGAGNLAGLCRRIGARLIHFSSDYVFSGSQERAYRESSRPRPQNTYGCSKLEGEKRIRATRALHFIFRVRLALRDPWQQFCANDAEGFPRIGPRAGGR